MNFDAFFRALNPTDDGSHDPFPYQRRLATSDWPDLIDIPTGLGKTAAVIIGWLWKLREGEPDTPRRLVYCLPMRTLVQQTERAARRWVEAAADAFASRNVVAPSVHVMMGGELDEEWERHPERPAILIGTQDMLLSRALNRGYAMSRYKWPMHFGLLNNDALWVFDETQIMGVGIETSAQLEGLRQKLGTLRRCRSVWMSATLGTGQLRTVDHPEPAEGWRIESLESDDREHDVVQRRLRAAKRVGATETRLESTSKTNLSAHAEAIAALVEAEHREGTLTLVVLNRVDRARAAFAKLMAKERWTRENASLVHSRFRARDRAKAEEVFKAEGDRLIVATQAVEAGVDISAATLITELAPWPSIVQRVGRCNRYGELDEGRVFWIDLDETGSRGDVALPYEPEKLIAARTILRDLADAGPRSVRAVPYEPAHQVRPVVRQKDLRELFDTTPDLAGNDIDVSRYVRDSADDDVQVYWRDFTLDEDRAPPTDTAFVRTQPDELCRVSIPAFANFLSTLRKRRTKLAKAGKSKRSASLLLHAWTWDHLDRRWVQLQRPRPGRAVMLHASAGGYSSVSGWTGEPLDATVTPVSGAGYQRSAVEVSMSDDERSQLGRWVLLTDHLEHVAREAQEVAHQLQLPTTLADAVRTAAAWHDVGKAHPCFQRMLRAGIDETIVSERPDPDELYAKSSNVRRGGRPERPYLRHELASALAWLANSDGADASLVAFLIAGHHGKVRLSIRALPGELEPPEPDRLFARGVWDGDHLASVTLPDGAETGEIELDLSPMLLGKGSWLERMLTLRDDPAYGPFRLGFLEAAIRVADWRASAREQGEVGDA